MTKFKSRDQIARQAHIWQKPFKIFFSGKKGQIDLYSIEDESVTNFAKMMTLGWHWLNYWQGQTKWTVSLGLGMYHLGFDPFKICSINKSSLTCDCVR